jgi:hypothetical protein
VSKGGGQGDIATPPIKRNVASLVGGFVIAGGCLVLWLLVAQQLSNGPLAAWVIGLGVVFATAVGVWIRVADL